MRMRTLFLTFALLVLAAAPLLAQPAWFDLPVSLCGANAYAQAHPGANLHIYVQSNPRFAPEYNFAVPNTAGMQNFLASQLPGYGYNRSTHTWYVITYNVVLVDWNLPYPGWDVKVLSPRADITNFKDQLWYFRLSNNCPNAVYWRDIADQPPTTETWGALKGLYR
jgi:hypothetical protein